MHLISCNWLPFYRPCSFASQTFICFAVFLIIALILMQKNWFHYTIALYCTQENITVLTTKNKKEQPIHILELFSYFRSPRSIDITVSCSFVLRLFHIPRTSFCFSVRFSELSSWKTVIMSRLMLYIFFQVWSATAGFPAPWFFPVTTEKFPTAAIIYIYWYHAFHTKMLFYPQYTSLSASNYPSFPLLHVLIVPVIMKNY